MGDNMKAAVCNGYGGTEFIEITTRKKPFPGKGELLIKNYATALHSADVRVRMLDVKSGLMRLVMRLVLGVNKPRNPVLGVVFAGVVESTGKGVTTFSAGDEVYGMTGFKMGTHAEYVVVPEDGMVTLKPAGASFEEAAAIPFGGHTALYYLQKAGITASEFPKVLIYGASGAVGSTAVQVAKYYGAHVTAVCSAFNKKMVKELGADVVLAYDQSDFQELADQFDIVFDAVGKINKQQASPLLNKKGRYVTVNGMSSAAEKIEQLQVLSKMYEAGQLKACIDRVLPFDKLIDAHQYVETGRKRGNVILRFV